jgi:hypothetical protein
VASALLLIVSFHIVLWVGLAVLTVLEPLHPERTIQLPDTPVEVVHGVSGEDGGESLPRAA